MLFRKAHLFGCLGLYFEVIVGFEKRTEFLFRDFDVRIMISHQKFAQLGNDLSAFLQEEEGGHYG